MAALARVLPLLWYLKKKNARFPTSLHSQSWSLPGSGVPKARASGSVGFISALPGAASPGPGHRSSRRELIQEAPRHGGPCHPPAHWSCGSPLPALFLESWVSVSELLICLRLLCLEDFQSFPLLTWPIPTSLVDI